MAALFALPKIGFLFLFLHGIDGGLYGAQQRVDQSVVEFEGLIDDERDKMQKAVFVGATRDLRDLGLDH